MTKDVLKREKNVLLSQYINAPAKEKVKILVKIMDIDEMLEVTSQSQK